MIYLLRPISLIAFLFVHSSFGHFLLNYPKSLGFSDAQEDDSPCGGFQVSFDNTTDFHVGGDSVYLTTLHPQSNFLFRGTLDQKASGNWMNLLPVIGEYGLGDFCEPSLSTPDSWAGAMGVLQVIQDAEDGVHYQCAAVKFVSGKGTPPSVCKNGTSVTASFTSDTTLLPASGTSIGTGNPPSTASSAASASSTAKKSSSLTQQSYMAPSVLWLCAIALGAFVRFAH